MEVRCKHTKQERISVVFYCLKFVKIQVGTGFYFNIAVECVLKDCVMVKYLMQESEASKSINGYFGPRSGKDNKFTFINCFGITI